VFLEFFSLCRWSALDDVAGDICIQHEARHGGSRDCGGESSRLSRKSSGTSTSIAKNDDQLALTGEMNISLLANPDFLDVCWETQFLRESHSRVGEGSRPGLSGSIETRARTSEETRQSTERGLLSISASFNHVTLRIHGSTPRVIDLAGTHPE
jgi:hypothetical protein